MQQRVMLSPARGTLNIAQKLVARGFVNRFRSDSKRELKNLWDYNAPRQAHKRDPLLTPKERVR